MRKKFLVLDLLRFSLAMYLALFHSIHQYPQSVDVPLIELAGMGGFVTSTFFILSGFILSHVYFHNSMSMQGGIRKFLVKRLSNLYVVHFIGLLLFCGIAVISTHAITSFALMTLDGSAEKTVSLSPLATAFNVALNVALLQVWNPLYGSINPS